ncbi:MAG: Neelaredoxin, partial [Lentisphaerae bacterium]|nr:Neelaredoxin [Lentisphaerota bacterium]
MNKLGEFVRSDDFKNEKHVPVIAAPAQVKADEWFDISVTVGKDIPHPNTTEHFIAWIALHFVPAGANFSYELGRCELSAHGQAVSGPNTGPAHTDSVFSTRVKLAQAGTLHATAYCNIHGL